MQIFSAKKHAFFAKISCKNGVKKGVQIKLNLHPYIGKKQMQCNIAIFIYCLSSYYVICKASGSSLLTCCRPCSMQSHDQHPFH